MSDPTCYEDLNGVGYVDLSNTFVENISDSDSDDDDWTESESDYDTDDGSDEQLDEEEEDSDEEYCRYSSDEEPISRKQIPPSWLWDNLGQSDDSEYGNSEIDVESSDSDFPFLDSDEEYTTDEEPIPKKKKQARKPLPCRPTSVDESERNIPNSGTSPKPNSQCRSTIDSNELGNVNNETEVEPGPSVLVGEKNVNILTNIKLPTEGIKLSDPKPDILPEVNIESSLIDEASDTSTTTHSGAQNIETPKLNIIPNFDSTAVLRDLKWNIVDEKCDPGFKCDIPFTELPGPKHVPAHNAKPIEYFNLFFPLNLLTKFVTETNRYANQYIANHAHKLEANAKSSRFWKPVTVGEMRAFIAVIINMSILIKMPVVESYWSTCWSRSTPWFPSMFSWTRFISILKFFHMVDNSTLPAKKEPGYDPFGKLLPLLETVNQLFSYHYTPHCELSVNESPIGTKRPRLLETLHYKHHPQRGEKMWILSDSVTKYCLGLFCYKGSRPNGTGKKSTELAINIVKRLLEIGQCFGKGFHLFTDYFFTSFPLAKYLYSKCTFLTGNVKRKRKDIPAHLKEKFAVGQKIYLRNDCHLFLGYREKENSKHPAIMLSTKHTAKSCTCKKTVIKMCKGKKQTESVEREIPVMIDSYKRFVGGVDGSDQLMCNYLKEDKPLKFWRKVTFNIFFRIFLNSYILYAENTTGKVLNRYRFIESIIEELRQEWFKEKNAAAFFYDEQNRSSCCSSQDAAEDGEVTNLENCWTNRLLDRT